jgi:hypothetical protein
MEIDTEKLGMALGNCLFWRAYVSRPSERARIRERRIFLRKAKKQAEVLHASMAASSQGRWRQEDRRLTEGTEHLLLDLESQLRDLERSALPTSSFEWLVGAHLPAIYEKFFDQQAGISRHRKKHSVKGPFLRFAKATLLELGVERKKGEAYADETISRAFTTDSSLARAAKLAADAAASARGELGSFYSRKSNLLSNSC